MEPQFTDRELDVMHVLWDVGGATATEVQQHLEDRLAYNTVLTMLRILEEKGFAGRKEEGRAHRYHALVARDAAGKTAVKKLVDGLFGGAPELLLSHLVNDKTLKRADIERMRKALDARLNKGDKK